jgi:hypothetical protein
MIRTAFLTLISLFHANAEVLLSHSFSGDAAAPLNGVPPDTNGIRPVAWNAGSIIAANGQVNDGANTDQGAVFDLGLSWKFKPQSTYTVKLGFGNLDNAIVFAGFRNANPSGGVQAQTQGTVFALRVREIAGSDNIGIFQWPGGAFTNAAELTYTANDVAEFTLEIKTNDLTDAVVKVGSAEIAVDLSTELFRYFFAGYEDPTSGTSDAKFMSIQLEGPPLPPLPQPVLTSVKPALGEVVISWPSKENETYTLQGSADLTSWTPLDGSDTSPFPGTGNLLEFTDPRSEDRYFYRVIRP